MGIKRYYASKDNTITNAFRANLSTRGTSSNMGASDILEVFSIYAQASSSSGLSSELSRVLVQFDTADLTADRAAGLIPASGSVSWFLKLYNAKHGQTLPSNFTLLVKGVSGSWDEGDGLDMEDYTDLGYSNWVSASSTAGWTSAGGDYHASPVFSQTFEVGTENLEVNVSSLVEQWLAGTKPNHGFGVFLTSSQENDTTRSYYTKKFFSRTSEFFFKKPVLEARFNATVKDNRGNFFYSSSLAPAADNLNTIYLQNTIRGRLANIPSIGTGNIYVSIFSGSTAPTGSALTLVADGTNVTVGSPTVVTGTYVSTGIYKATFAITAAATPLTTLFDVWHNGNLSTQFFTGSIAPSTFGASDNQSHSQFLNKITNLKSIYAPDELARMRVYSRPRNWSPTIYNVAKNIPETTVIPSSSFTVFRIVDDLEVIPFGTGSDLETLLSYDVKGNYFDLDMSMLEPDYSYGIRLAHYNEFNGSWEIQPETFKFRVEKRQAE